MNYLFKHVRVILITPLVGLFLLVISSPQIIGAQEFSEGSFDVFFSNNVLGELESCG